MDHKSSDDAFLDFLQLPKHGKILEVGGNKLAGAIKKRASGLDVVSDEAAGGRFSVGEEAFDLVFCRHFLENVKDPGAALDDCFRALKYEGKLCLQENNVLVHTSYPHCVQFEQLWQKYVMIQAALGEDVTIGKKLFYLARHAGFRDVTLSLYPEVHWSGSAAFEPWVRGLVASLETAKAPLLDQGFAKEKEFESAVGELHRLLDRDDGSVYFYRNRVTAIKPKNLRS